MPPVENGVSAGGRRWDPIQEARQESLKTPEDNLRDEINKVLAARLESVRGEVNAWLNGSDGFEQITSRTPSGGGSSLSERDFQEKVDQALATKISDITAGQTAPILLDPHSLITRAGMADTLDPDQLEASCMTRFREGISSTVKEEFKARQANKTDNDQKELVDLVGRVSSSIEAGDTKSWIEAARALVDKVAPSERIILDKVISDTGLVSLDGRGTRDIARTTALMGIVSLGAYSSAAGFAALVGGDVGMAIAGGIIIANGAFNTLCKWRIDAKIEGLYDAVKNQIKEAGTMPAVMLWTGVLSHVIEKCNPTIINRDKCSLFGNTALTTLSTTQKHIDDLATYACKQIDLKSTQEPTGMNWLARDGYVNSLWSKAEKNLDSFLGRWRAAPAMIAHCGWYSAGIGLYLVKDFIGFLPDILSNIGSRISPFL